MLVPLPAEFSTVYQLAPTRQPDFTSASWKRVSGAAEGSRLNSFDLAIYYFFSTRESSYCFQRILAIAVLSVHLSVHLSVTRVDQSKTVQARITKSSLSAAWKTLVSGTVKLFHKFEGVTLNEGAKWEGVGQNLRFLVNKLPYLSNGVR